MEHYDIIVIGAGHAGCEAANICAVMGKKTLLLTLNLDMIGQMSCNPAIGGLAKGQLVKEMDVLGGIMGLITDKSCIQFRMLNKSKGVAVWSPRAQADRILYRTEMRAYLEQVENLYIKQGLAKEIIIENNIVKGVKTISGKEYSCNSAILSAGTFLNGLIHIGMQSYPSGRAGEPPSEYITENLIKYGFKTGRLKTGTPPRLDGSTIDFDKIIEQKGDDTVEPFSHRSKVLCEKQVSCHITHTNKRTHEIIEGSFGESPLFTGKIKGVGPRYCPSIEDKIDKFKGKESHQIFLEPEGHTTNEYYVNGFATSIPEWAQLEAIHSIKGLEHAEIIRPGYAIEYDFFDPTQLKSTMETKLVENLFFAGQINGTSGYEEAGAQGLMAGINAVLKINGENPFILRRDEAYIGVLIDDLVTKGTNEPYRMFTSRAEYRLLLRQDNADERLGKHAYNLGIINEKELDNLKKKYLRIKEMIEWLNKNSLTPEGANEILKSKNLSVLTQKVRAINILKRPEISFDDIKQMGDIPDICKSKAEEFAVSTEVKYEGYFARQRDEVKKIKKFESTIIPENFDFNSVFGLLTESRQKLEKIKPHTIGQASRISGVTPADISILMAEINVSRGTTKNTET